MDFFSVAFENMSLGLATALTPNNFFYCFLGVFLGMLVGVIPGIGALAAISLLFPLTFQIEPGTALIMLAGIYYGTAYGGSTAAILLNVPGTPSSAVACLDGYPLAKQGRGGVALLLTATSSFIAGSIGIVLMMFFSPLIVDVAIGFTSADYFSVMLLGLVAASIISDSSVLKGLIMIVLGAFWGSIGMDMYTGTERFSFGSPDLIEGISIVALAIGLFGVAEIIASIPTVVDGEVKTVSMRSMVPTKDDVRRSWLPTLRGSMIGSFFGTLPGTGASIASFMSYAVEKQISREPQRFGKGAIEGLCAPEAANNAADQTAFIPTMTLGIPGSATMALMLGVLMIHGITPGPTVMVQHPEMFWGLVMSFWIGNLILLLLNIPLIGLWVRVLQIPYPLLYPAIIMFICMGVYSVNNSTFEVWMVLGFGVLGYFLRTQGYPLAPMLLGFVLSPLIEENFRRALIISGGDATTFFREPISLVALSLTLILLAYGLFKAVRGGQQNVAQSSEA